jgi:hypothetical protein
MWSLSTGIGLAAVLAATLSPSADAQIHTTAGQPQATSAAVAPRRTAVASAGVSATGLQQFWTPARLAAATPDDAVSTAKGSAQAGSARPSGVHGQAVSPDGLGHAYDNARPSIGIIVYADKNLKTHYCTASVVQSPGKNLIMTAAHCRPGYWVAFVPDYRSGAPTQPYGIWSVKTVYTDSHYAATGSGTDYDYAFAKVGPDSKGRLLQNVTGGNVLTRTPSYHNWAGVTGYPEVGSAPADKAITCWNWTSQLPGYAQMQFLCTGYYSGTSGSPWLIHLNTSTNTGDVIGLIGGVQYGGPNSWTSYSPVFGNAIFSLYAYALKH